MLLKSNTVPLALCSLRRSINRQRHRRENIAKYNTFTVYPKGTMSHYPNRVILFSWWINVLFHFMIYTLEFFFIIFLFNELVVYKKQHFIYCTRFFHFTDNYPLPFVKVILESWGQQKIRICWWDFWLYNVNNPSGRKCTLDVSHWVEKRTYLFILKMNNDLIWNLVRFCWFSSFSNTNSTLYTAA